MSTMTPQQVTDPSGGDLGRRRRLQEQRQFRVEQLAALDAGASRPRRTCVDKALRMAATTALREIDDALNRMDRGEYGTCVTCSQPIPESRLDVLPMTPQCMSCHYNGQNVRIARVRTRNG